ncbi:MAG: nucleotidyltransferase domain-containing protein [Candidatus Binataceae bacterium]
MTREFDFLLAAVRRFFQPESPLPSMEGLEWNEVLRLADRHAVTAFFCRACQNPELKETSLRAARFNLTLSAELVRLLDLLEKQRIDVVSLKGPVLGAALYGDEALKTSSDLDLLVLPSDAVHAIRALQSIGYRLDSTAHWPAERALLRDPNSELSFSDPSGRVKLDLHWRLLPSYFPVIADDADLWVRLRPVAWSRARANTLAPEHLLPFLCVHGAKHMWERLGWLCDVARLLQVERNLNWPELFARARRSDTRRMLALGMALAADLLGIELPPAARDSAFADPRVRELAATAIARMRADGPPSAFTTTMFLARAFERRNSRIRLAAGMVLEPNEAEYRALQLPPRLYGMYYFLRPLRLTIKYGRRVAGL